MWVTADYHGHRIILLIFIFLAKAEAYYTAPTQRAMQNDYFIIKVRSGSVVQWQLHNKASSACSACKLLQYRKLLKRSSRCGAIEEESFVKEVAVLLNYYYTASCNH